MAQPQMQSQLDNMLLTAGRLLEARGFRIVTADDRLFPSIVPSLGALKDDRLLICSARAYGATDQFLNPDEMNQIRDELDKLVTANRPDRDQRVARIDKVAFILVPGDITIASSEGDVKWLVIEDAEELPEEMDRGFGWS